MLIEDNYTIVGSRVKELRKAKGWSLKELGKRVGVTDVSILGYEKGTKRPKTSTLLRLAAVLEVKPKYLLGVSVKVIDSFEYSEFDYKIIDAIKSNDDLYEMFMKNFDDTIKKMNSML